MSEVQSPLNLSVNSQNVSVGVRAATDITYKDLLLHKLYYAVICSVISQLVIVFLYVLVVNGNISNPSEWISATLQTFTQFSTVFYTLLFLVITCAQCVICAKDYVVDTAHCYNTRFHKLTNSISLHNCVLCCLHACSGGLLVWQLLHSSGSKYHQFVKDDYLIHSSVVLVLSGIWTGVYCFSRSRQPLSFPIVFQSKWFQLRSSLLRLWRVSCYHAIKPTIYFSLLHFLFGQRIINGIAQFLHLETAQENINIIIYCYIWWFTTLYTFSLSLMRLFFAIFLTEPVTFTIDDTALSLSRSISMDTVPIVQHLAALDLYLLAFWHRERRQELFSLSHCGGHPHHWNSLVQSANHVIDRYTELVEMALGKIVKDVVPVFRQSSLMDNHQRSQIRFLSQTCIPDDVVNVEYQRGTQNRFISLVRRVYTTFTQIVKHLIGLEYLMADQAEYIGLMQFLQNGHLIVWITQGIAELCVKSLDEDRYGIVQKDIAMLVERLIRLRVGLSKVTKMGLVRRFGGNQEQINTLKWIISAVQRSISNIWFHFKPYINDLGLNKNTMDYINENVAF